MSDVVVDGVVTLVKLPSLPDAALLPLLFTQPDKEAASAAAAKNFAIFLFNIFSPFLDFQKNVTFNDISDNDIIVHYLSEKNNRN